MVIMMVNMVDMMVDIMIDMVFMMIDMMMVDMVDMKVNMVDTMDRSPFFKWWSNERVPLQMPNYECQIFLVFNVSYRRTMRNKIHNTPK